MLDLCYEEDSRAAVDMNVIMTGGGKYIEVQGTAEGQPYDRARLNRLLDVAQFGIDALLAKAARSRRRPRVSNVLVLATRNPHKVDEMRALLAVCRSNSSASTPFPARPSRKKREHVCGKRAHQGRVGGRATGHLALADDSGICIDALGGRPGVFPPAGPGRVPGAPEWIAKTLAELTNVPDQERAARYICALALSAPDGTSSPNPKARLKAASRARRAANAASATTRFPRRRRSGRAHGRRTFRGREKRVVPSRQAVRALIPPCALLAAM
jgi:hypothetical protein